MGSIFTVETTTTFSRTLWLTTQSIPAVSIFFLKRLCQHYSNSTIQILVQIIIKPFSSEIDQPHYALELFTKMLVHDHEDRISSGDVATQLNTIKQKVIKFSTFPLE
jgi:hypothetical protein